MPHTPPSFPVPASPVDRRTFLKTASAAGLGLTVARTARGAQGPPGRRTRYAIVGLGSRFD